MTLDRPTLITQLMNKPREIHEAETLVLQRQAQLDTAKASLTEQEGQHLLSGAIDGKNAEQRQAQLYSLTGTARAVVSGAEQNLAEARANLSRLQNEFRALQSVARLFESEVA